MVRTNTRKPIEKTPTLCDSKNWKPLFRLTIPGVPPSTNTLYGSGMFHKRRFMTGKGRVYKNTVQDLSLELYKHPLTKEVLGYSMRLFFNDVRRRDNANYEKCLIDALQGIVFEDDSQFKVTKIEKHIDKENPRTEIEIFKYEPTKAEVLKGLVDAKKTLELADRKDFENPCLSCPILFYWVTEGLVPDPGQQTLCANYIKRNLEYSCPKRPRKGVVDMVIGEGISKWL